MNDNTINESSKTEDTDNKNDEIRAVRNSLEKRPDGVVRQTISNAIAVLNNDPLLKGAIRRNELSCKTDIVKEMDWRRRSKTFTDTDFNNIMLRMEKLYGITRDKNIKRAIDIVGNNNHYHPIIDRLESLEWDGVVRVRHLLPKYLGTEESDYIYEATRIMMMGAVQRVYNPGCKFEYMVCLVGGQGAGKSSFLRFLTMENEWFSDDLRKLDDENVFRKIQGHWIIEMAEMLATCNARSVEEIKSFLSRQSETYRFPMKHIRKTDQDSAYLWVRPTMLTFYLLTGQVTEDLYLYLLIRKRQSNIPLKMRMRQEVIWNSVGQKSWTCITGVLIRNLYLIRNLRKS